MFWAVRTHLSHYLSLHSDQYSNIEICENFKFGLINPSAADLIENGNIEFHQIQRGDL